MSAYTAFASAVLAADAFWRETALKKLTTWVYNGDSYQGSVVTCAPAGATVPADTGGTQPIGVLCRKIGQATSEINGSQGFCAALVGTPRVWSYTYNPYGQGLTADGPRTDVNDVTIYTYYDAADPDLGKRGNVATITNALGHVASITAYDLNGYTKHHLTVEARVKNNTEACSTS